MSWKQDISLSSIFFCSNSYNSSFRFRPFIERKGTLTTSVSLVTQKVGNLALADSKKSMDSYAPFANAKVMTVLEASAFKRVKNKQNAISLEQEQKEKNNKEIRYFFNQCFDKGRLKNFVLWFLLNYGENKTVRLVEQLKNIGFQYASKAGISLGVEDLKIPPKKAELIFFAEKETSMTVNQYTRGEITGVERFQRLIDTWHRTSEALKQEVIDHFERTDILNPVYMMAFSGARGNISQVRQLVGMRGLMADPQGQILDFPIRSNFREGLTLTEYIISSYGARKGIVDTALRTANAGYLTRRLVDVAQHVIVTNFDCRTKRGIFLTNMKEGNKTIYSLSQKLVGRVLARDLITVDKKKIASRNEEITSELAFEISKKFDKVFVRSSLTCEKLLCQLCYGWSLGQGKLVSIGEAVGVVAAQSIGEPGTQLTMRTFHTGGVFSGDISDQIKAPFDGIIEYITAIPGTLIRTPEGKIAFLTKGEGSFTIHYQVETDKKDKVKEKTFKIPPYTLLYMRNGQNVFEKEVIAQISSISQKTNKTDDAELTIKSEIEGQFYSKSLTLREKIVGWVPPEYDALSEQSSLVEQSLPSFAGQKTTFSAPLVPTEQAYTSNSFSKKKTERAQQKLEPFNEIPKNTRGSKVADLDKLYEAWTWGYAWILSGKIYNFKKPSPSFPIIGDYLSTKSYMTQTHWSLSKNKSSNVSLDLVKRTPHSSFSFNNYARVSSEDKNAPPSFNKFIPNQTTPILLLNLKRILYKKSGYVLELSKKVQFISNNGRALANYSTNLSNPLPQAESFFLPDLRKQSFYPVGEPFSLEKGASKSTFGGGRQQRQSESPSSSLRELPSALLIPFDPQKGSKIPFSGIELSFDPIEGNRRALHSKSVSCLTLASKSQNQRFPSQGLNFPSIPSKEIAHGASFKEKDFLFFIKPSIAENAIVPNEGRNNKNSFLKDQKLNKKSLNKLPYFLQWFPHKYKTNSGGLLIFDNPYKKLFFGKQETIKKQQKPYSFNTTISLKKIYNTHTSRSYFLRQREIFNSKILWVPYNVFKFAKKESTFNSVKLFSNNKKEERIFSLFFTNKTNFFQINRQGCFSLSNFYSIRGESFYQNSAARLSKEKTSTTFLKLKKSTSYVIQQEQDKTSKIDLSSILQAKQLPFICSENKNHFFFLISKKKGKIANKAVELKQKLLLFQWVMREYNPNVKKFWLTEEQHSFVETKDKPASIAQSSLQALPNQSLTLKSFCKAIESFTARNLQSSFKKIQSLISLSLNVSKKKSNKKDKEIGVDNESLYRSLLLVYRAAFFLKFIKRQIKHITTSLFLEKNYNKMKFFTHSCLDKSKHFSLVSENKSKLFSFINNQKTNYNLKNLYHFKAKFNTCTTFEDFSLTLAVASGFSFVFYTVQQDQTGMPKLKENGNLQKNKAQLLKAIVEFLSKMNDTKKSLFNNTYMSFSAPIRTERNYSYSFGHDKKNKKKEQKLLDKKQQMKKVTSYYATGKKGWVYFPDIPPSVSKKDKAKRTFPHPANSFDNKFALDMTKKLSSNNDSFDILKKYSFNSFVKYNKKTLAAGQTVLNQISFNMPVYVESLLLNDVFNIEKIDSFSFFKEKEKNKNEFKNPLRNFLRGDRKQSFSPNASKAFALAKTEGEPFSFDKGANKSNKLYWVKNENTRFSFIQTFKNNNVDCTTLSDFATADKDMVVVPLASKAFATDVVIAFASAKGTKVGSHLPGGEDAHLSACFSSNPLGLLFQPIQEYEQMSNLDLKNYVYDYNKNPLKNTVLNLVPSTQLNLQCEQPSNPYKEKCKTRKTKRKIFVNKSFDSLTNMQQYKRERKNKKAFTIKPLFSFLSFKERFLKNNLFYKQYQYIPYNSKQSYFKIFTQKKKNYMLKESSLYNKILSKMPKEDFSIVPNMLLRNLINKQKDANIINSRKSLNVFPFIISHNKMFSLPISFSETQQFKFSHQPLYSFDTLIYPNLSYQITKLLSFYISLASSPTIVRERGSLENKINSLSVTHLISNVFECPCFSYNLIQPLNLEPFKKDKMQKTKFLYSSHYQKNNSNTKLKQVEQVQAQTNYYSPFTGEMVYTQKTVNLSLFLEKDKNIASLSTFKSKSALKNKNRKEEKILPLHHSCMFLTKKDLISYYLPHISSKAYSTNFSFLNAKVPIVAHTQSQPMQDSFDSQNHVPLRAPFYVIKDTIVQFLNMTESQSAQLSNNISFITLNKQEFVNTSNTVITISNTQAGKPIFKNSPFRKYNSIKKKKLMSKVKSKKRITQSLQKGSNAVNAFLKGNNKEFKQFVKTNNSHASHVKQNFISFLGDFYVYGDSIGTSWPLKSELPQYYITEGNNGQTITKDVIASSSNNSSLAEQSKKAVKASGKIIHYNNCKITLRRAQPIFISPKAILHKVDGDFIDPKAPVITLSYQQLKSGDIIQGIPKVEQFFEARTTKRGRLFRDSLPSLLKALFKRYQSKFPLEVAVRQSFYKIQQIIVDGVQRVYKSQGVTIADKHLEVIVKQMTSKVRIIDGAQTGFFPGEVVELSFVEKINSFLIKKITYEPLVLGITKASLEVDSFLSASSFQQTTRVLSQAAIYRKKDYLKGLKENVILGNLIPAGTGYLVYLDDVLS